LKRSETISKARRSRRLPGNARTNRRATSVARDTRVKQIERV
jgi:hypothetical protein